MINHVRTPGLWFQVNSRNIYKYLLLFLSVYARSHSLELQSQFKLRHIDELFEIHKTTTVWQHWLTSASQINRTARFNEQQLVEKDTLSRNMFTLRHVRDIKKYFGQTRGEY